MSLHEEHTTEIGERRKVPRRGSHIELRVTVDAREVRGRAENISRAGVFFFSGDALNVTVEVDCDGEPRSYPGRIVRVERMSEETTGYAIEFDPV